MAYVDDSLVERDTLRQGDLIADIHLVGSICFKDVQVPNSVVSDSTAKSWMVGGELKTGPVVVLSHCCEVSRENGVKLTSIVLAPLRDVSKSTAPRMVQDLIQSNDIGAGGVDHSFLKYYYLPPHMRLAFHEGGVVDFSKIFSVRKSSYDIVLGRKFAQVTDETREFMALKLGLYFYRKDAAA